MFIATLSVRSLFFPLALAGLVLLGVESHAEVYRVNTTADILTLPGSTTISLRSALIEANNIVGPEDSIVLPAGTYTLKIAGIEPPESASHGDLDILDSVTINGAGPDKTIIDGNALDQVFHIHGGLPNDITVKIENLTIQNGRVIDEVHSSGGAGLVNYQKLTLNNVVVRNNSAEKLEGAGIQNEGELFLNKVVIRDNTVVGDTYTDTGGGILNRGTLVLTDTTVSGNQAPYGGGLYNAGESKATIERTLFSGNKALSGSAMYVWGNLQLINTTIHGNNFPGFTGGRCAVRVEKTADILFSTITDNLSTYYEAGLCRASGAILTLRGTILAGNKQIGVSASNNCSYGDPITKLYNIEDADTCNFSPDTNLINTDPKLGPLQDNGGPTLTRALAADSPAIDYVRVNTGVTVDQRGFTRPVGPWADIGAYEYEPPPLCFPVKSPDGKSAIICL